MFKLAAKVTASMAHWTPSANWSEPLQKPKNYMNKICFKIDFRHAA